MVLEGNTIQLDLPVRVPDLTLRLTGVEVRGVSVDGVGLTRAGRRAVFKSNTFFAENNTTFVAFNPTHRQPVVKVQA